MSCMLPSILWMVLNDQSWPSVRAFCVPLRVLAVNSVESRHCISIYLSSERKDGTCVRAEFDVVHVDPALNFSRLMRALEMPRNNIAILIDLNCLQGTTGFVNVICVNRPVARNFVRGLLSRRLLSDRLKNRPEQPRCKHHISQTFGHTVLRQITSCGMLSQIINRESCLPSSRLKGMTDAKCVSVPTKPLIGRNLFVKDTPKCLNPSYGALFNNCWKRNGLLGLLGER